MRSVCLALLLALMIGRGAAAQAPEHLIYHDIRADAAGRIVPWYSDDPGIAYDHCIRLVWSFWKRMAPCPNGVSYYLQHQVWRPEHDARGLGGDQLSMALSSWALLYAYTGDPAVVADMRHMADYWLAHGMSAPDAAWPNLPYPYNTDIHSGRYDGDMKAGKGVLQPDKAGSFGAELLTLHKLTGDRKYLDAAIRIADTLAAKVAAGDGEHSPWPFRVNATTGELPTGVAAAYTSNWTGALRLFEGLIARKAPHAGRYAEVRQGVIAWLKAYPLKSKQWGPFFEDVPGDSNTQINADTLAWYILEHPSWGPTWRRDARAILDWTGATFGNPAWARYGVTAINEQTSYMKPGNSHSSRHASVELMYAERTGDASRKAASVRVLNWATYMVDGDGKNRYPGSDIWLTDGYGDYVRHYLRSMGAAPELAPAGQNHILRSSSVVTDARYSRREVRYTTYDRASREVLRLAFTPGSVTAGGGKLPRLGSTAELGKREGYTFAATGDARGVLRIRHDHSGSVRVGLRALPSAAAP